MKKVSLFLTAMLLSLSLMGCNINKDKNNNATNNATTDKCRYECRPGEQIIMRITMMARQNWKLPRTRRTGLLNWKESESASVIVTDRNAYAAVVLEGDHTVNNADNNDNLNNNDDTAANKNNGTNNDHNNADQVLSPRLGKQNCGKSQRSK